MDGLRAVLQIRGKLAFRPPCGSPVTVIVMRAWLAVTGVPPVVHCRKTGLSAPVTVIVMRAWLAVTGVPPVVHCRKTGLSAVALSAMEGKLVLRHGAL